MKLIPNCLFFGLLIAATNLSSPALAQDLAEQVTIRRTTYGVPHITANNMLAAGFALGYLQLEDYGNVVPDGLIRARGEWSRYHSLNNEERAKSIDKDAASKLRFERAVETFPLLRKETQDMFTGFAAGVNRYIELHRSEFPSWMKPNFTAFDVQAKDIGSHDPVAVANFLRKLNRENSLVLGPETGSLKLDSSTIWAKIADQAEAPHSDEGSNAWALAPSRTKSNHAILLRNPHLAWNSGYYEAHLMIPGVMNFYGDFRIGGPLVTIGGYNEHLGFSTTNNDPDTDELYSLQLSPKNPNAYILDGKEIPITKKIVSVKYREGAGILEKSCEFEFTKFGPIIHRQGDKIYIIRDAAEGEFRLAEQFLLMMKARNLEEYKSAMRIQAKASSNFTYADAAGNIFYVWNAMTPQLPVPSGGDTTAIAVTQSDQIWQKIVSFDDLPQLLNPKGGYLHNENDPFHYTNLNEVMDASKFPSYFSQPMLRLRSQHALSLIANKKKISLEEVVKLKYSQRMLLAERVKKDLIKAVERTKPTGESAAALNQLKAWDNTVNRDSKGGVLFEVWWERYVELANHGKKISGTKESAGYPAVADSLFAKIWSPAKPATTPFGLASRSHAVEAFTWAIATCNKRYGSWDLAWGDVNRAHIGNKDIPISGASGELGTFSVLWFVPHQNTPQKREARGGDGWVLAVEFGALPRAYSVLVYGQSNKADSPFYADQLELYGNQEMKSVAFTEEDIAKQVIMEYHPGKEVKK